MQKSRAAVAISTIVFFSIFTLSAQADSLEFLPLPDLTVPQDNGNLDAPVIIVPPPGTYSDDSDENDELEGPVSEGEETVEGTVINPEDLPIEEIAGMVT